MVFSNENNFKDESRKIRERILDSAEQVFSSKGFTATTVREITSKAECNLAAVNYHFGSKHNLYLEIFRRNLVLLRDARINSIRKVMSRQKESITLEKLIKAFADSFIEPLVDKSTGQDFMKLMMHEMLDPHLPKKMFAEQVAIPTISEFGKAVKTVCPEIGNKKIIMSVFSIIGQLMHAVHISEMFREEMDIDLQFPDLSELVDHIVAFSAAGIKAVSEKSSVVE